MPIKISITGILGSGKTAVCKELEKKNLKCFSTGLIQRSIAVEKGMSTLELNAYAETHPEIDKLIDSKLCKLSDSPDDMIIDSRMAWHFVKDTFKVYLWADETVAASRVISHQRGPSEGYTDVNQAKSKLKARKHSEDNRFKEKYGVDCGNFLNFDLVMDTTDVLPDYIAGVIMDKYTHRTPDAKGPVFLISPRCLYPTVLFDTKSFPALDKPVKVICSGGYFYIYEGEQEDSHRRAVSQRMMDKPLIACELAAQNRDIVAGGLSADEYARKEFSIHKARVWEELNGFKYETYPE